MKQFKTISITALALLFVVAFAGGPVLAEHGSGSDGTGGGGSGSDSSVTTTLATTGTTETETEHSTTEIEASHPELRKKGLDELTEVRKDHKEHSQADRQKFCEAHKDGLTNKFSRIVTNSERIQAKISKIQDKAIAYQTDKNVTVANWADLVDAANTAKATSAASIEALKAVKPSIDCNNTSVASDVATFKAAAATTRDNLKAYRSSVKDMLKALEAAKDSTEGSQT